MRVRTCASASAPAGSPEPLAIVPQMPARKPQEAETPAEAEPVDGASKIGTKKRSRATAFFLRGLLVILPVVFTLAIFVVVINFVNQYVTSPINRAIYWSLEHNAVGWRVLRELRIEPYDAEYLDVRLLPLGLQHKFDREGYSVEFADDVGRHREKSESFFRDLEELGINADRLRRDVGRNVPPVFGIALSILLVFGLGYLASGFIGRQIIQRVDRGLNRLPLVRSVYPYTKQLVEFALSDTKIEFDTVVAAPYPSKGIWAIGFVTGNALRTLRTRTGRDLVTVFIPTSPMPMTGFTIFVDAADIHPLPFTVDEALRVTVSGGVLVPPKEYVADLDRQALADAAPRARSGSEAVEPSGSESAP